MNNTLRMWAIFVAGIAVAAVGWSYAFMGMWNADVKAAVDVGDYSAFVAAAPQRLLEKVDSPESFQEFAARSQEMEALRETNQAAVLAAVQANDFAAFQQAHEDMKTQMDALRPDDAPQGNRPEPTVEQQADFEAKQQEHFDELVSYYQENGELPERAEWPGFGKHGMGRGEHGHCDGDRNDLEDPDGEAELKQ